MAMFNSYVKLPEGKSTSSTSLVTVMYLWFFAQDPAAAGYGGAMAMEIGWARRTCRSKCGSVSYGVSVHKLYVFHRAKPSQRFQVSLSNLLFLWLYTNISKDSKQGYAMVSFWFPLLFMCSQFRGLVVRLWAQGRDVKHSSALRCSRRGWAVQKVPLSDVGDVGELNFHLWKCWIYQYIYHNSPNHLPAGSKTESYGRRFFQFFPGSI